MFIVGEGLKPTRSAKPKERQPEAQKIKHGVKFMVRAASLLPTCLNEGRGGAQGAKRFSYILSAKNGFSCYILRTFTNSVWV